MNLLKNIATILFLMGTLTLSAQTAQERAYEQKGEELLQEAARKLKSYNSMKIDFTYEMVNETQNISESMKGTLIAKGDKYHMEVAGNAFISDGVTVWSYLEDMDEVHINLVENTDGGLTPTSLLEDFETQFRSKFIRQERHNGRMVDIIDLVPTQPQAFFKYRIALDASTKLIAYTAAYDRHGGIYTYHVDRFQPNPSVNDALFTFKPGDYPGIEIIDLR
jgi:outer membrane lipoprotein carrier protein